MSSVSFATTNKLTEAEGILKSDKKLMCKVRVHSYKIKPIGAGKHCIGPNYALSNDKLFLSMVIGCGTLLGVLIELVVVWCEHRLLHSHCQQPP